MKNKKKTKVYDRRHGGPYDRGSCDSYYGRGVNPHFFVGATYATPQVKKEDMTEDEIKAYMQGYNDNEESGTFKQW